MRIAILGAECTGKTCLAHDLMVALQGDLPSIALQEEVQSGWRAPRSNTLTPQDLQSLAEAQIAAILNHPAETTLLCDTAPLQLAVYSDLLLGDDTLYPWALAQHQTFSLTLLAGMDVPPVASTARGFDRVRRLRVDQRLRQVLQQHGIAFSTVYGQGPERAQQARLSILGAFGAAPKMPASNWKWSCEKCSDADCEHRLFSDLLGPA